MRLLRFDKYINFQNSTSYKRRKHTTLFWLLANLNFFVTWAMGYSSLPVLTTHICTHDNIFCSLVSKTMCFLIALSSLSFAIKFKLKFIPYIEVIQNCRWLRIVEFTVFIILIFYHINYPWFETIQLFISESANIHSISSGVVGVSV